jgi:hypothetical protein
LREHRDAVALLDPERAHDVDPGVDAPPELRVGEAGVAADDGFFRRVREESALEEIEFIERNNQGRTS